MVEKSIIVFITFLSTLVLVPLLTQGGIQEVSNTKNPLIYEISVRPWLYELSKKHGVQITKLNDIPMSEFEHLKSQGIDYIWLMGIWKLGSYGVNFDKQQQGNIEYYKRMIPDFTMDDVIGSPYAVTEFVCNPELGSDADILSLKVRLNKLGLKLLLDFVPNHSAVDSKYTQSNPEFYIRAPKNTQTPFDSNKYLPNGISYGGDLYDGFWKDTAQWNYWSQDARNYLKGVVLKIASLSDGMRCDMAMVLLNDLFYAQWRESLDSWGYQRPSQEFWSEAIRETKSKYPNTIFLAEVYWGKEQQLIDNGFDFIYEKTILDQLASKDVNQVRNSINSLSQNYAEHCNHFIENHDEPRAVEKFGGKDYIANVAAMISYTLPGAKFINHGQLEGYQNKLDVHLRRGNSESGSDYSKWFYAQLLPILSRPVFHENSTWQRLSVSGNDSWRFLAWKVTNPNEKLLVVINFSDANASGAVIVPDAGNGDLQVTELMKHSIYTRNGDQMRSSGLQVVVDAWNGQILKY